MESLRLFLVIFLFFCSFSLISQDTSGHHVQTTNLNKTDLINLFSETNDRGIYILELNDDLSLHLQFRKCDKHYNGGEVKIYDVVNFASSEFLLAKSGDNYFATFSRNGWDNYLISFLNGNLIWMEEIWKETDCKTVDSGINFDDLKNKIGERSEEDFSDSLNIMMIFNEEGKSRVENYLNIQGDTALFMWSNVAISYMNLTLENSGVPGFCRLALVKDVVYNVNSIPHALGSMSSYSGNLAQFKALGEDNCIHITSFLIDYVGPPVGQAISFGLTREKLHSASIISFQTFCHELGHNLGFGHGPNASSGGGFLPISKGYSTILDGIPGANLSTLMDYERRVFTFSNTTHPYTGEYTHHNGRILGNESRNNAGTLITTYPFIKDINSKRVFIDTTICEGTTIHGYSEPGNYLDTFPDPESCTGFQIRRIVLKTTPSIESNYEDEKNITQHYFDAYLDGSSHKTSIVINDELWANSNFHIYKFNDINESFEKIVSFPDPITGGELSGETEIIIGFTKIMNELYVASNKGTYKLDQESWTWVKLEWSKLPVASEETGTLHRISGDSLLRSIDSGSTWEILNLDFESGPNGVSLHTIRELDGYWFLQQYAPYHLYISKDDGISWTKSNTNFLPFTNKLFIDKGVFFIRAINVLEYYRSYDEGLNWVKDDVFNSNYENIFYRDLDSTLFLQKQNLELFSSHEDTEIPYYLTKLSERISHLYENYLVITSSNIKLIRLDSISPIYENIRICEGEEYFGFTDPGDYIYTRSEENGCDTTFRLTLHVNPTSNMTIDTVMCYGESIDSYNISGTYIDVFENIENCDSIRTLNLTVLDSVSLASRIFSDNGMGDGAILIDTIVGGLPPYRLEWSTGSNLHSIINLAAGDYELSIIDDNNCIYTYDFIIDLQSNLNEIDTLNPIFISPNPLKPGAVVKILGNLSNFERIKIIDINGKIVKQETLESPNVTVPEMPGFYLLQIFNGEEIISLKMIVN